MLVRQLNRSHTDHSAPGGANPIIQVVIRVAIAIPDLSTPLTLDARAYLYAAKRLCNNRADFCVPHTT